MTKSQLVKIKVPIKDYIEYEEEYWLKFKIIGTFSSYLEEILSNSFSVNLALTLNRFVHASKGAACVDYGKPVKWFFKELWDVTLPIGSEHKNYGQQMIEWERVLRFYTESKEKERHFSTMTPKNFEETLNQWATLRDLADELSCTLDLRHEQEMDGLFKDYYKEDSGE